MFSSRHPENIKPLAARLGPLAQVGTVEQAVAYGDVILLAVPYGALEEIGKAHARGIASKRLVIDVCNPYPGRETDALIKWVEAQGGAGIATTKLIPGAKVVRAFNVLAPDAVRSMVHSTGNNAVPIAGDDAKAIATAEEILRGAGLEPVLMGNLAKGRYLVPGGPIRNVRVPAMLRQLALTLK
jgi:predicted dinucleotide-binding enzyme